MFGVPLADAVAVASVREGFMVPAVIFRCVEYLSEMGGTREDGIYRMSGSAAVVKGLKDRFNAGAFGAVCLYSADCVRRGRLQPPRLGRVL